MRVFKVHSFARFARREGISDQRLAGTIIRLESGLIDADLGGGLVKLRIARPGKGRSGGYRTIITYSQGLMAVFLYGFAKTDQGNVSPPQLADLKRAAVHFLARTDSELDVDVEEGRLEEIVYGQED